MSGKPLEKKILIVEDELSVLKVMADLMELEGYQVVTASDGEKALELVRTNCFDFIICDVRMPQFSGKIFYQEIQNFRPSLKNRIAFVTGDVVSSDTLDWLEGAGVPYLYKPFRMNDLGRIVKESLGEIDGGENRNDTAVNARGPERLR